MTQVIADDLHVPFEGPEKLLEIWFKPSANEVPATAQPLASGRTGLRRIDRRVWEEMLDVVKCQVLSVIEGVEMDAYLLSESSFFVAPHRVILKTCGTTLNLLGLPHILEIASTQANMPSVYRCFYSRKSFMFPERQLGPHKDWKDEVEYLDNLFTNGSAYTVGKMNGDHWLLYLTSPEDESSPNTGPALPLDFPAYDSLPDYTLEILMGDLRATAREPFFSYLTPSDDPHLHAAALSARLGITHIFPSHLTTLDAYSFSPCGYSANALIKWRNPSDKTTPQCGIQNQTIDASKEGYYTIHVTPEAGWSYASFECNIPSHYSESTPTVPDLRSLVQRVVAIFMPGRLSLTLFISKGDNEAGLGESIETAQQAFKLALANPGLDDGHSDIQSNDFQSTDSNVGGGYKRTDKINYEFGGYDLAFASFELV